MPKVHKVHCPGDYAVGYGRPPKAGRIKPGERRNPNGRPKKKKAPAMLLPEPLRALVIEELLRPVTIIEGGREVVIPTIQAIIRKRNIQALKGLQGATKEALADAERLALIEQTSAAKIFEINTTDPNEAARIYQDMVQGRLS